MKNSFVVNKFEISLEIWKKISVYESWISVVFMGFIGIIVIVLVIFCLVILDFIFVI